MHLKRMEPISVMHSESRNPLLRSTNVVLPFYCDLLYWFRWLHGMKLKKYVPACKNVPWLGCGMWETRGIMCSKQRKKNMKNVQNKRSLLLPLVGCASVKLAHFLPGSHLCLSAMSSSPTSSIRSCSCCDHHWGSVPLRVKVVQPEQPVSSYIIVVRLTFTVAAAGGPPHVVYAYLHTCMVCVCCCKLYTVSRAWSRVRKFPLRVGLGRDRDKFRWCWCIFFHTLCLSIFPAPGFVVCIVLHILCINVLQFPCPSVFRVKVFLRVWGVFLPVEVQLGVVREMGWTFGSHFLENHLKVKEPHHP